MQFEKIYVNPEVTRRNHQVEEVVNTIVRSYDKLMGRLRLGGRAGAYDDYSYEFVGGANDALRKKHYDKSLRLLWKAEQHMPWSDFRDCTREEKQLMEMAMDNLKDAERKQLDYISSDEYKELLNREYTQEEKQAIVNILALIGHGEAYAWMVSTEILREIETTGARAAMTMQVFEEAKHFVVLRELIYAFDCEVPRMNIWEYMLLEQTLKSSGVEKFFGMNVVVEGFALSLFGLLGEMPGLEILKMFHRDESRHTALPNNVFQENPLTWWQKNSPVRQLRRLVLVLPAIPFLMYIEDDFATLGLDSFEFGGSMLRKITNLSERVGFHLPGDTEKLVLGINDLFNNYCDVSRSRHSFQKYHTAETTRGEEQLALEREVFQLIGSGLNIGRKKKRKSPARTEAVAA